ncbi:MAG: nucleotide exchange factor GrpE, partial [Planctomycetota bacterium]
NILNITNGILAQVAGDFDLDGYEDLIIATKEPCIQGEVCLYWYKNYQGNFSRIQLSFDLGVGTKVISMQAEDMNNDGYKDLVLVDDRSNLFLYYNNRGNFETDGQRIANLGTKLEAGNPNDLLVLYDELPEDTVLEEIQKGYLLNSFVIRTSKVVVSQKSTQEDIQNQEKTKEEKGD